MAQRVTLDAMIPREDFARDEDEVIVNLFGDFPISHLLKESPYLRLLRKPDFQRETNHWTPDQFATFIASFVDGEVIPSLILWRSPTYIFIIDGGHRISAIRAWINDDYGDGPISLDFYKGEIPNEQKKIAKRARALVESKVGRYSWLRDMAAKPGTSELINRRSNVLLTRALNLQWIQGNAAAAETSFFKINSQGTPLDETEEMLIRNRKKPIAIAARAIFRSGFGHKYWSAFDEFSCDLIEGHARQFYQAVFQPEAATPLKTLDVPLGGTVSPVDAFALLIDFLTIAGNRDQIQKNIAAYEDDLDGSQTITILTQAFEVIERITGNQASSLGLHPAVYFYNERGRYNRFLFLGMVSLITEKLRNNDSLFFLKFKSARQLLEEFLIGNKSLITNILQNLSKKQRIPKMKSMFEYIILENVKRTSPTPLAVMEHIGLSGRIFDVNALAYGPAISDDTKSMIFVRSAIQSALRCPLCQGLLDPTKSVSYDHKTRVRDGGTGDATNIQMVHPYCNSVRDRD